MHADTHTHLLLPPLPLFHPLFRAQVCTHAWQVVSALTMAVLMEPMPGFVEILTERAVKLAIDVINADRSLLPSAALRSVFRLVHGPSDSIQEWSRLSSATEQANFWIDDDILLIMSIDDRLVTMPKKKTH